MTKTNQLRSEIQLLQDQVRLQLVEAAKACAENVLPLLPGPGESLTTQQFAKIRWEMLCAGFTHNEISGIMSKIKAAAANQESLKSENDWVSLVATRYLEPLDENTDAFDLYMYQGSYKDRLEGKLLNQHEKLVFLTGKRINEILLGKSPEKQSAHIKRIATDTGVTEELVWRMATGGTRVPSSILDKTNRVLRRMLAFAEEANG